MSLEEYTKTTWKIIDPPSPTPCKKDEVIKISGPSANVSVICSGSHKYENGVYQDSSDTIENDVYVISFVKKNPYQIKCSLKGPQGGSWTADDNAGGYGNGGE